MDSKARVKAQFLELFGLKVKKKNQIRKA